MKQYLELIDDVLKNGTKREDRTGVGTIGSFARQTRYDLRQGFPLLTTKKVAWKAMVYELLWFLQGETNIRPLVLNNVKIWNEWPYAKYIKSTSFQGESQAEFIEKIKNDENFANQWGALGPVYGKQWRNFGGVDQISQLIHDLKNNPYSRRHIVSAWNAGEINQMLLPPCHAFFQFYVSPDGYLSLQLYQRSADLFLGVPFNIASYSLLLMLVAHVTGYKPGEFIHTLGDAHIYSNHVDQVKLQMSREPLPLPKVVLNPNIKNIFDFKFEDIELINYQSHPSIKAEVAV